MMLMIIVGCEREDERLAQLAREAANQQSAQNTEMARLNREVAEGTRRLVESDAQAREELLAAQRDLQSQQEQIGLARDALEAERREWAQQRQTESVFAPILGTLGMALLALLPLGLCWYLLHGLSRVEEQQIGELLIEDLIAEEPKLLSPPRAVPQSAPALGHQSDSTAEDDADADDTPSISEQV